MLKNKTKIITIFAILILLFSSTFVFAENEIPSQTSSDDVTAETTQTPQTTQTQETDIKKSDVYLCENNVNIDYIVDGNVFAVGKTVTINSQIGGDAFICAEKVIIDTQGYIFNNLFVVASSVEINGVVYDAYVCAQDFTINGGYIYHDLRAGCENLNIFGTIGRDAFVGSENISFQKDQNSTQGMVNGDFTYYSANELTFPEGAIIGTKIHKEVKIDNETDIQDYIISLGSTLALVVILWLVYLWLAPKFLESTNNLVKNKKSYIIISGLLGLIAIPCISIILLMLGITANVALILLGIYALLLVISQSVFMITANNYICNKLKINKNIGIVGMLILSSLVIWLIYLIPVLGGIVSFITIVLGLGIIITYLITRNSSTDFTKKEIETKEEKLEEEKSKKENEKNEKNENEKKDENK